MNIFGTAEARHFCRGFSTSATPAAPSLITFCNAFPDKRISSVAEGTPIFDELRACILQNAERCLFLSVSNYRRAFDLFSASSSSWAHVTLYYGTFFAAHGLLGLFGAWLHPSRCRIQVSKRTPGSQELQVERSPKSWGNYRGTHERFWDYFYAGASSLVPYVGAREVFALQPLNAKVDWHTKHRNRINYDTWDAVELASSFRSTFRRSRSRRSLPSPMNSQLAVLETLLVLTLRFRTQLGLKTDAIDRLSTGPADLRVHLRNLVYDASRPANCQALKKGLIAR